MDQDDSRFSGARCRTHSGARGRDWKIDPHKLSLYFYPNPAPKPKSPSDILPFPRFCPEKDKELKEENRWPGLEERFRPGQAAQKLRGAKDQVIARRFAAREIGVRARPVDRFYAAHRWFFP